MQQPSQRNAVLAQDCDLRKHMSRLGSIWRADVKRLYMSNMHALINQVVASVNSSKTKVILLPHIALMISSGVRRSAAPGGR